MVFKNLKLILVYSILILTVPSIFALTLQELIDSYNFGYNDGTLNINLFNDYIRADFAHFYNPCSFICFYFAAVFKIAVTLCLG